jgi:hypothetical protein
MDSDWEGLGAVGVDAVGAELDAIYEPLGVAARA